MHCAWPACGPSHHLSVCLGGHARMADCFPCLLQCEGAPVRWACGADRTEEECHKDCRAAAAQEQAGGGGGSNGGGGCGCDEASPSVPVCASSGKVYSSHCQLKVRWRKQPLEGEELPPTACKLCLALARPVAAAGGARTRLPPAPLLPAHPWKGPPAPPRAPAVRKRGPQVGVRPEEGL